MQSIGRPVSALAADSRPSALILAPEAPYPLAGGGALRSASLLQYLAQAHAVDLIVFRNPARPIRREHAARTGAPPHVIDLPPIGADLAARALRNSARLARRVPPLVDRFAGFDPQIAQAVEGRRYTVGVIEHSGARLSRASCAHL